MIEIEFTQIEMKELLRSLKGRRYVLERINGTTEDKKVIFSLIIKLTNALKEESNGRDSGSTD